ncbi:MAG TPA: 2-dehydropantoate 2-reductase [Hyphomicrobiales bacterium]|nr:2-dehydropantoate 2-reductase [Hyphomicrobiales bacterium]
MTALRICVYGVGVIGGLLAAALARKGHDVTVVGRGPHLAAIRDGGLVIAAGAARTVTPLRATDRGADCGPQDLVIVATKTVAHPEIAGAVAAMLAPGGVAIFAANGVFWFYGDGFRPGGRDIALADLDPVGTLHREIGADRAMGMVCFAGGEIREPGVIEKTDSYGAGHFIAGAAVAGAAERGLAIAAALDGPDARIVGTSDIRQAMWRKYIPVVGSQAIAALTGATVGELYGDADVREVALALMGEAHAVALAHGFADLGFDPEAVRRRPNTTPHKTSMLQDLERGRPMEIPSQFGALKAMALQTGVATPTLDVVLPLLRLRARLAGCLAPAANTLQRRPAI